MITYSAGNDLPLYEIKIKGQVDSQWQEWFDDLAITPTDDGNTVLHGPITDQSAMHGVLKKINNLGLTLISVNPQSEKA
ncbi:MAG: hypothetical protein GY805_32070 [Chloroflexi bacterium]|nr:hypothetical protein [Chloroflexota bacterium]